jgi:hypothetical protein
VSLLYHDDLGRSVVPAVTRRPLESPIRRRERCARADRSTARLARDRAPVDGPARACATGSVKHDVKKSTSLISTPASTALPRPSRLAPHLGSSPQARPLAPGAVVVVARRAADAQGP